MSPSLIRSAASGTGAGRLCPGTLGGGAEGGVGWGRRAWRVMEGREARAGEHPAVWLSAIRAASRPGTPAPQPPATEFKLLPFPGARAPGRARALPPGPSPHPCCARKPEGMAAVYSVP